MVGKQRIANIFFACLVSGIPFLVQAQNTGKLAGYITDAETGMSLPGATIILEGTTYGTAAGIDGKYRIIGIPVGAYTVKVSFVGYQTESITGTEISSGYTRELNFALQAGVELDEIVVAYERPLIQKDAIGVPKLVTAEEIKNLPVRGVTEVAKIQAGVVSKEGSSTLNVRGGRSDEVLYFVDGVKVIGTTGIPQSAIQEQEMLIGSISARYGDAMTGIINVTTKSGSPNFFGTVEALTSQGLDPYGYTLGSATLGGPLLTNKLNFFLSGEFVDQQDNNPRAIGELYLSDTILDNLRAAPQAVFGQDALGNNVLMPIPGTITDGAQVPVDNAGNIVVENGAITLSDGTVIQIPEGVDLSTLAFNPASRAEHLTENDFSIKQAKRQKGSNNLALAGNLTWNVIENGRLRIGGRYNTSEFDDLFGRASLPFSPEVKRIGERDDYQVYGTWTQYLSNSTFYQIQVDYAKNFGENYDPRFGKKFDDFLFYGDIDHPASSTIKSYKNMVMQEEIREDENGNPVTVLVPTYVNRYNDGSGPSGETTAGLVSAVGGGYNGYSKFHNTQFRLSASATSQVGLHQLEFGIEYEQRTQRWWSISASRLARYYADGNPEGIDPDDPDLNPEGYTTYADVPTRLLPSGGVGYDRRGMKKVNSEDFEAFLSTDKFKPDEAYNQAPYQPIYYGAFIQDKIEFRDIVLNLGLRVDVFDNNTRVFIDKFARRPIVRAGDLETTPPGIGPEYAVYFNSDTVVGYRDLNNVFYDTQGQETNVLDVVLAGKPRMTNDKITPEMFEDYDPRITWMPRIGVSFPVTDRALFFASYGIVSQRPSRNYVSLAGLAGTRRIDNNDLHPEKTTKYELGFRQRIGMRSAFTVSGFFHQVQDNSSWWVYPYAFPNGYSTRENEDFGTVKGLELGFDLRRTAGVALNANYTLAFAQGSDQNVVDQGQIMSNLIRLYYDQRHKFNLSLDYRLGAGEGPTLFGAKVLEHFGINFLATAGSGFPYTRHREVFAVNARSGGRPIGDLNGVDMPWTQRIDLRVDRRFPLRTKASVTAILWVQNLFDTQNVQNVWRFTGLPDNDGYLSTAAGIQFLESGTPVAETAYNHRIRNLNHVGIPRMIRLGVRLDF